MPTRIRSFPEKLLHAFKVQRRLGVPLRFVDEAGGQVRVLREQVVYRVPGGDDAVAPCPLCGGTDRFQYTDKFGEGNYHCRSCGAGGGLKLAHAVRGGRFSELLDDIESLVGSVRPASSPGLAGPSLERMKRLCHQTWTEAKPVVIGDEVDRYLRGRGIDQGAYRITRQDPDLCFLLDNLITGNQVLAA